MTETCFPIELWQMHVIPHLDAEDIVEVMCMNSAFKCLNWKYMVIVRYPTLYKNLFTEIINDNNIVKKEIDYEQLYLTLHNKSELLCGLSVFIKNSNVVKVHILQYFCNNVLSDILIPHLNPYIYGDILLVQLCKNKSYIT